jgi:hypothetical protein
LRYLLRYLQKHKQLQGGPKKALTKFKQKFLLVTLLFKFFLWKLREIFWFHFATFFRSPHICSIKKNFFNQEKPTCRLHENDICVDTKGGILVQIKVAQQLGVCRCRVITVGHNWDDVRMHPVRKQREGLKELFEWDSFFEVLKCCMSKCEGSGCSVFWFVKF